jgi:hypothetical protein
MSEENKTTPAEQEVERVKCVIIPEDKLAELLDRLKSYEKKEDDLAEACLNILSELGIVDKTTGKLLPEFQGENFSLVTIMKKLFDMFSMTDMMFRKKKFEEDMLQKFGFLKNLLYIFQEYVERKQHEQQLAGK